MRKTSTNKAKGKKNRPKTKLGIPDLEHSKAAVLRSLGSADSRRGYQHAIDEFVAWYCSEPRLAFNKTVVLRYRFHLEERGLAPGTINVRMAAVRRLAYEAADSGLLSPELAAGIQRVKGARKLGSRLGNWLTASEAGGALAGIRWTNSALPEHHQVAHAIFSNSFEVPALGRRISQAHNQILRGTNRGKVTHLIISVLASGRKTGYSDRRPKSRIFGKFGEVSDNPVLRE